ncbi:uncharacterized protein N7483_005410 [Penicillium malachiteum]|uniref:uncharacterized protein n=1 Tax=Penicillium malachiteum TaxID=1324776 RepID=UPI0025477740|nr:uncharacterized protein N7483_005410 [Penicillium malachiteum]KAJ5730902.1 hypothetical protein N7483_005410 [Penicillium malachiteum]
MALVRDPYFWKRFSTAVHLDEEAKGIPSEVSTPASEKPQDSWLERERRKSKKSLIWGVRHLLCHYPPCYWWCHCMVVEQAQLASKH